jgi:translation initiation factor SUI1
MDINFNDEELEIEEKENVTISKQQRNGRKCWTIIENFANKLDDKDDVKKFLKHVKKTKCCNGSIKDNNVIRLQGDCVEFIKGLLVEKYNYSDDEIRIKGV